MIFVFSFTSTTHILLQLLLPSILIDPSERNNEGDDSSVDDDDDGINNEEFLNNDFGQYTIHDILRQQDEMNIAQVQHSRKEAAWNAIRELEGKEVVCKSGTDGNITWKVVKEVTDDRFSERLGKEKEW